MKSKTLRVVIPLLVMLVIAVGYFLTSGIGTLSAIGWGSVSLLCPLGALTTMLASKTVVPQAVISLVIAVVAILILGRAFCAWICPVPVVSKLRDIFKRKAPEAQDAENAPNGETPLELTAEEKALISKKACSGSCSSCAEKRGSVDSRHFVLGGALLSAAIFGFPVFCLICPIGLTFATILLVILLFTNGDVTWSVVVIPALLAVEVIFFKKWCHKLCPLGALMSLVAKGNKTFKPTIDDDACLETSKDATCGKCAQACPEGIDPRHPERGASWSECTKCRACVDACPAHAISMPLLPPKHAASVQTDQDESKPKKHETDSCA